MPVEPAGRPGRPLSTRPAEAAPGYRDWTSPSRSKEAPLVAPPATEAIPDREIPRGSGSGTPHRALAPSTELIPDRGSSAQADGWDDDWDDPVEDEGDRDDAADRGRPALSGPETGPSTGVVGGRAAFRAERQAAEAERRKEARRSGAATSAVPDDDGQRRGASGVRRAATGLLAVAVVALLVLGVYGFTASDAQEAGRSQQSAPTSSTATSPAAPSSALPPLDVAPLPGVEEPAPAGAPARAPVTVLNATGISGLAADVAAAIGTGGWESPGVGQYQGGDVALTTVYFTAGDEAQRQAALALIEQYPQISGPAERFFEVPDVAAPGLVLVTTGEWRP
ncbi:hypothetical protein GCU56_07065 [Geodermatophilus sabuli]|uniref:LytR/CpsA/Psr regulator C-terminal domain-containing protein n=1 Tax=Geodermatophilus sabuli TaxID=1564158 RepID=A0A7K3VYC8_9ACTN|nr:hypothetical protein [Geodermatophilus sabuli]